MTFSFSSFSWILSPFAEAVANIWRGYVLSILWVWFAVPYGMPALTLLSAYMIVVIVGFITHVGGTKCDWMEKIISYIIFPLAMLFAGSIVHYFIF